MSKKSRRSNHLPFVKAIRINLWLPRRKISYIHLQRSESIEFKMRIRMVRILCSYLQVVCQVFHMRRQLYKSQLVTSCFNLFVNYFIFLWKCLRQWFYYVVSDAQNRHIPHYNTVLFLWLNPVKTNCSYIKANSK